MRFKVFAFGFLSMLATVAAYAQTTTINIGFEEDNLGQPPAGFSFALTGRGKPGVWIIKKDEAASSQHQVLAQIKPDPTGYRFPICVFDKIVAKDLDVSVKFKPISGKEDQGAGIVWRYKDPDNYYVVRANALEGNVVLYKVENGTRTDLPLKDGGRTYGKGDKVPSGEWGVLRVVVHGKLFEVYHDGRKLFQVEDETFKDAGKVGLWTKADSVIYFDDFTITVK
jgi:hypothetical protein